MPVPTGIHRKSLDSFSNPGLHSRPAVASLARLACAGDGDYALGCGVHTSPAIVPGVRDVQIPTGIHRKALASSSNLA